MLETSRPVTSLGSGMPMTDPRGQWRYHRRHTYRDALRCPAAKGRPKVIKIRDGTDVAARYLVYKLHDATGGQPMQWHVLLGMGESAATISRQLSEAGSFSMGPSRRRARPR
jgi:hypothetical protein